MPREICEVRYQGKLCTRHAVAVLKSKNGEMVMNAYSDCMTRIRGPVIVKRGEERVPLEGIERVA